MITKKVSRHYCEFCKKAGFHLPRIKNHEDHCTLNPNRKCGVCGYINGGDGESLNKAIEYLKSMQPAIDKALFEEDLHYDERDFYQKGRLGNPIYEQTLTRLYEIVGNCPVCVLAAIRITKGTLPGFDYKEEMKIAWERYNEDNPHPAAYDGGCW